MFQVIVADNLATHHDALANGKFSDTIFIWTAIAFVIDESNTSVTTKISSLVLHYTRVKVGNSPTWRRVERHSAIDRRNQ